MCTGPGKISDIIFCPNTTAATVKEVSLFTGMFAHGRIVICKNTKPSKLNAPMTSILLSMLLVSSTQLLHRDYRHWWPLNWDCPHYMPLHYFKLYMDGRFLSVIKNWKILKKKVFQNYSLNNTFKCFFFFHICLFLEVLDNLVIE